jgi:hypothetical protein
MNMDNIIDTLLAFGVFCLLIVLSLGGEVAEPAETETMDEAAITEETLEITTDEKTEEEKDWDVLVGPIKLFVLSIICLVPGLIGFKFVKSNKIADIFLIFATAGICGILLSILLIGGTFVFGGI